MSKLFSCNGLNVYLNEEQTSSMKKLSIDLFMSVDKSFKKSSDPVNTQVYSAWLNNHKKLPKFWSIKEGKLIYKIGIFCFIEENFTKDLEQLITNYYSFITK